MTARLQSCNLSTCIAHEVIRAVLGSLAVDVSNPRYSSTAALSSSIGKSSQIVFWPKLDVRTEAEDEEESG